MNNLIKTLWLGGLAFSAMMLVCIAVVGPLSGYEIGPNYEEIWTWKAIFLPLMFGGFFVSFMGMLLAALTLDRK